jgi:hypothetical protein
MSSKASVKTIASVCWGKLVTKAVRSLTTAQLLDAYRAAADLHGRSTKSGNFRAVNGAAWRLAEFNKEIQHRGAEAEEEFLRMLSDQSDYVRVWCASHSLGFRPDLGEAVLTSLVSSGGHIGLSAEVTLREWRAVRLKL